VQSSPRHHSTDHSPTAVVNRDASRSFAGRDNGGHARHAEADRGGLPDGVGQRRVVSRLWPDGHNPRRSRCGRDRSGCRSPPGHGNAHRETVAPGWGRADRTGRAADDGRGNNCDTAPACVPRHGVVHGAEARPGSWTSAPCLPPIVQSRRRLHQPAQSRTAADSQFRTALTLTHMGQTPSRAAVSAQPMTVRLQATAETSPNLRGFRQPSTDAGHESRKLARQLRRDGWNLQIVKRKQRSSKVAGLTWIVERTFAWLGFNRRLSKDYECYVQTSETMLDIAAIRLMLYRVAPQ
jgi:transposase